VYISPTAWLGTAVMRRVASCPTSAACLCACGLSPSYSNLQTCAAVYTRQASDVLQYINSAGMCRQACAVRAHSASVYAWQGKAAWFAGACIRT
jgi:hypothetical protein